MTIKETVRQVLPFIAGNKPINLFSIFFLVSTQENPISESQIKRALRDLPHVRKVNGRYIVKGRRVPAPRLDITQPEN